MSAWAKRFGLVITALAVIGFSGCSADAPAPDAAPTTQAPAGPPADGGRYALPSDIADKIKAAGLGCEDLEHLVDETRGSCTASTGDRITIRVIVDSAELQREIEAMGKATFLKGSVMLAGQNWTVVSKAPLIEDIKPILGGTLTPAPS